MDMSKYLGLFASEAGEHLEALGKELLRFEGAPGPDLLDSIFRHAHSVKGMAASMGFEPIAAVAHRAEDLIDALRERPSRVTRDAIDLLLRATDAMTAQVQIAVAGQPLAVDNALVYALAESLKRLTDPNPPQREQGTRNPEPETQAVETESTDWGRLSVKVKIAQSSPTPGVRAFLVHKKLSGLGQIFDLRPPLEDLRAGRLVDNQLSLVLETRAGEAAVRRMLAQVSDLDTVDVAPLPSLAVEAPPPEKPEKTEPAPEAPRPIGVEPARTVRVKTEVLDHFLDGVGELLLATAHLRDLAKKLPERERPPFDEGIDRLHGIVKDLHDRVMGARMTPLAQITDRLPRAARDILRRTGKDAELVITGQDIELDRAILDELADPLLHLLRNCLDHGLESPADREAAGKPARGRVRVAARRDRDRVLLEIEDDGRGMDPEALKASAIARGFITADQAEKLTLREAMMLACMPGVSTARSVSDLSGRGVGMDAVKRVVENLGGTLDIDSERGRGTRFTLRLPLTVAVVNVLLIGVGEEIYGLPIAKVVGAVELDQSELYRSQGARMLSHGGELLPVHALASLLAVPSGPTRNEQPYVVVEGDGARLALEVDRLLGQEEVVLKPLSRPLERIAGLSGVTILGSGRPIFILDVPRLLP
ncbi:MAG: chemotaxis protein CheA [Deltaproteobacteria bacterium]|nr:chemotaxis protein CheA [Deltaproteobacteria bacterium]